uniref:Uncharacterized protein n=1 Tax=Anguilla anguilla TaxID=7936 RepID=A0A0E9RVP3_ANGAN
MLVVMLSYIDLPKMAMRGDGEI